MMLLEESKYKYNCLLAEVSSEVKDSLLEFGKKLLNKKDIVESEDKPHVTVLYGIHKTVKKDELDAIVSKIKHPIEAKLTRISLFENDECDVLKFDVDSPQLHKLNAAVRRGVEYTNSYPDYHPHLTIAYVKKGTGKKYTSEKLFNNYPLTFTNLRYHSSTGSLIKEWFLLKSFEDYFKRSKK